MHVLVLRGGALGDFLVTLPALALLRQRWPDARIECVGNRTAAALALHRGLIDTAHSQHDSRWAALYAPEPLPPGLAAWLERFDLILNYWPDPQQELSRHLPRRPGQTLLRAAAHPVVAPAAAHFCAPLLLPGQAVGDLHYRLRTPAPAPDRVALHPGSGSSRKNWPADRWRALAHWLQAERQCDVRVITGEAEPADLLAGLGIHLRQRPLAEVADELARCRLFIGHDSGISHLAAAAGAPCLLLFGPTDPAMWAPPAPGVRVLQRGADLADLSLAEVQQAVSAALSDPR